MGTSQLVFEYRQQMSALLTSLEQLPWGAYLRAAVECYGEGRTLAAASSLALTANWGSPDEFAVKLEAGLIRPPLEAYHASSAIIIGVGEALRLQRAHQGTHRQITATRQLRKDALTTQIIYPDMPAEVRLVAGVAGMAISDLDMWTANQLRDAREILGVNEPALTSAWEALQDAFQRES